MGVNVAAHTRHVFLGTASALIGGGGAGATQV